MAKKTENENYFAERIKPYEEAAAAHLKHESEVIAECRETPDKAAAKLFALASEMLDLASNYIVINGTSLAVLDVRAEEALNEGRKSVYKALIYIESIVTAKVNAPYSEYEEHTAELAEIPEDARYKLARKIGLTIELLKDAYGSNTKWRWSFVEVDGRFAAAAKNMIDLKKAESSKLGDPDYEIYASHIDLVKRLLLAASEKYTERYQMSTRRSDDLLTSVNFLGALKYLCALTGDKEGAEAAQKKYDMGNNTLETLHKRAADIK